MSFSFSRALAFALAVLSWVAPICALTFCFSIALALALALLPNAILGRLGILLEASWSVLGASYGRLGTLFGALWSVLGASWGRLGRLGGIPQTS